MFSASPALRVLLVVAQATARAFAKKGLKGLGISVEAVGDGDEAFRRASGANFDAVVMDIVLPGRSGLSILRDLREQRKMVPVILLTARAVLSETLEAFSAGADDYLAKPYHIEELAVRLRTIVRRNAMESPHLLHTGDLAVDLLARKVTRGVDEISLTTREFELLEFLMRPAGRLFDRAQIYRHVWGGDMSSGSNLVEVYVQRLRAKIDKDHELKLLRTVRNSGYVLGGH